MINQIVYFHPSQLLKQSWNSLIIKIKCFISFSFFCKYSVYTRNYFCGTYCFASNTLWRHNMDIRFAKIAPFEENHRWPIDYPQRASNVDLLYCLCCLRGQAVKQFICQGYKASWHSCDSTVKDAMSNRYFCESWCLRQFLALFLCVISILVDTLDYNTNMSWTIFIVKYEKSRRNSDWM